MMDEFPEQGPNEETRLWCLHGKKKVILPCVELDEEGDSTSLRWPKA